MKESGMKRLVLVGAILVLSGCAAPTQPQPRQAAPRPSPPVIVHMLVMTSPPGQGAIELRRDSRVQDGIMTSTYTAQGAILLTDDVGQWRFAYTKTSLEGPAPVAPAEWIVGLHAISVIVTNTSPGPVEIDWERSAFVDSSGRTQRMIHRGVQLNQKNLPMEPSGIAPGATLREFVFPGDGIVFSAPGRASLWNAPAALERLAPGFGFTIELNIKKGDTKAPRTFKFSAVAPAPAGVTAPPAPR
jgi:hypothetical protein